MSTKYSLFYDSDLKVHVYDEAFDGDNIYIDLSDVNYEVHRHNQCNSLTVAIPLAIFEIIQQIKLPSRDYANMTDEEISAKVLELMKEAKETNLGLFGSYFVLGPRGTPEEEQYENGVKWYNEVREKERKINETIKNAIDKHLGG